MSLTVLMACFNAARFVEESVASILGQTFEEFEFIVVDDGSSDETCAILEAFARQDPRLRVVASPHSGIVGALNRGLEVCNGDVIARMDADDVAYPERFARQIAYLAEHPEVTVVGSWARVIDEHGQPSTLLTPPESPAGLDGSRRVPVLNPTVMFRRSAFDSVGGYRAAFSTAEDFDLWLRMREQGFVLANLQEVLLDYRWHGGNVSTDPGRIQSAAATRARLSQRMRLAGLPDPFTTADAELAPGEIPWDRFPVHVREPERAQWVRRTLRDFDLTPSAAEELADEVRGALEDSGHVADLTEAAWALAISAIRRRRPREAVAWFVVALRCDPRRMLRAARGAVVARTPRRA